MQIRNIAIIAHVDHGKTTLVDALLKQTNTFRANQREMSETLIMDSNDLEREKGITILAKNTSVVYRDTKINIIDTPGHADFGGEVERVLNMASGAILLVDAAEGPLPQTRFVLKKALEAKLKIILLINKIDKKDARVEEITHQVENLFLELAHDESALHFPVLYAVGRDGKVFGELPKAYSPETPGSLAPLLDKILQIVPDSAVGAEEPFQMLISTLDSDAYVGKLCIGKVSRGTLKKGDAIALVGSVANASLGPPANLSARASEGEGALVEAGKLAPSEMLRVNSGVKGFPTFHATKLYTSNGLKRDEVEEITAGDICAIAGIPELTIGQTVTDPSKPEALPTISVEEPTIKVTIGPNTSPFAGREGKWTTSRQIKERLLKEKETNLGLRIEECTSSGGDQEGTPPLKRARPELVSGGAGGIAFTVSGRGELHLAVLIETMRREGYEMEVSKPQVVYKEEILSPASTSSSGTAPLEKSLPRTGSGEPVKRILEPYEEVTIDVDQEYTGAVTEEMGRRKGVMQNMEPQQGNQMRLVFKISSYNLLGVRNVMLTKTRGTAVMSAYFLGYEPKGNAKEAIRNGAVIVDKSGTTMTYGLLNAQERSTLFVGPGLEVYEGMIVGLAARPDDLEINVCKEKQLTNNRSSGEGVKEALEPATILSLEQCLDFIEDDELLEVTPKSLRLRKKLLTQVERKRAGRG